MPGVVPGAAPGAGRPSDDDRSDREVEDDGEDQRGCRGERAEAHPGGAHPGAAYPSRRGHRAVRRLIPAPGAANMCSCRSRATILHADLDAFFAAVEQRDDPALRGRPVIVGGGVVLAASYEARARGVRSAMGGAAGAAAVPAGRRRAAAVDGLLEASRAVFEVFERTAPVVEALSIDEAFLDVRGLGHIGGTPGEIAARAAARGARGRRAADHASAWRDRDLAKVASGVAKPDGLLVVPPGGELRVPAPARRSSGCGASARRPRGGCARPGSPASASSRAWARRRS